MQPQNPYESQNPYQPPYPQQNPYPPQPQNPYTPQPQNPYPAQGQPQQFNGQPLAGPPPRRSRRWLWIVLAVVVVLILACVGGIAAFVASVNNSPAKAAAQHYYDAIKARDYSSAYSYLDPTMKLTVGNQSEQINQQNFTTVGQAYDTQKGRVSDYSITGVTLNSSTGNGNTADVTVKVTRNTSYDVHLQLKQEGSDWKVISFDSL